MKTFLAWTIANIGGVMLFFVIMIYEILLFTGNLVNSPEVDFGNMVFMFPILIVLLYGLLGGSPTNGLIGDLFNIVMIAIAYLFAYLLKDNVEYSFLSIYFWGIIPSAIAAILVAIFTATHMDEVVSRRMTYVNSHADLFEVTMLYTINRFVATFSAVGYVFLMIALYNNYSI